MQAASLDPGAGLEPEAVDPIEPVIAGVAHDFGNILAVVTNYLSLASRRVDDPATAELLDKVRLAAHRAARLNRQLHDLAECGGATAQPVRVNQVVDDARMLLASGVPDDCRLAVDLADKPLVARASATGLEMALRHLVDNACEAMPQGGVVTLATRRLADIDRGSMIEVSVSDTGVGMSPDVLAQALEPRFSTQPRGQATGLGLTIADRAVRAVGGEVRIESAEGSGTTVRIRLAEAGEDE